MKIKNYGRFTQYADDLYLLYRNEDGQDWNAMQMGTEDVPGLVKLGEKGRLISSVHDLWAMVDDDMKITNVSIDPSTLVPFDKTIIGIDGADIATIVEGMIYDGQTITVAPEPTIEELRAAMPSISKRQLRLTLVRNGYPLGTVASAIYGMEDGLAKDEAAIEWDSADTYERLNPTLLTIASALSITPEQVDAMWEQAVAA